MHLIHHPDEPDGALDVPGDAWLAHHLVHHPGEPDGVGANGPLTAADPALSRLESWRGTSADFEAFERMMARTLETRPMRILAYRVLSTT